MSERAFAVERTGPLEEEMRMSKRTATPKGDWRLTRGWAVELDDYVQGLDLSADGQHVAAGTLGGELELLRAADGSVVHAYPSPHGGQGVLGAAFLPSGEALATAGEDGQIALWDVASGALRWRAPVGKGWVEQLCCSHDGTLIAASCGKTVAIFDTSGVLIGQIDGHKSAVTSLFWHPARQAFFSACFGGLHELAHRTGTVTRSYAYEGSLLTAVCSPDGRILASGNQDATMHIWYAGTTKDLAMSGYEGKIDALAFGELGPLLACADGSALLVWNFSGAGPAGTHPLEIAGHEGRIHDVLFRRGGTLLLSVGADGTLHGARRHPTWGTGFIDRVDVPLRALRSTSGGERIVAAGDEGKLFGWSASY